MAGTNVADALVEYLSSRGVENIFGVLAHSSFAIGDAIARRPPMRFVNAQHEGGAGNMALGYARATKKPAVCLVSAGGGATNIATAVAQAHKESVPLFVISSDIDTAASAKRPFSSFHGMEHVRLFQPITKHSAKLERIEELGPLLDSMFRQTTRGPSGPGLFNRPRRFAARPASRAVALRARRRAGRPGDGCRRGASNRRSFAPGHHAGGARRHRRRLGRRARRSARARRAAIAAGCSELYGQRRLS